MRFELMIFCLRDKRLTPLAKRAKKNWGFRLEISVFPECPLSFQLSVNTYNLMYELTNI